MNLQVKLTKTQEKLLRIMQDTDETLVYSKGGGWWIGEHRTNGKLVFALLRGCLISMDSCSHKKYEIYFINETGTKALENGHYIILT